MQTVLTFIDATGGFLLMLAIIIVLAAVVTIRHKPKPKFVMLTEETVTDNMQRQAVYLARKLAKAIELNGKDRQIAFENISKELNHFRHTFADVPGAAHEYQDLKTFLDQQKELQLS